MENINGIIKDGKAYKAVEIDEVTPCEYCDFWEECSNEFAKFIGNGEYRDLSE